MLRIAHNATKPDFKPTRLTKADLFKIECDAVLWHLQKNDKKKADNFLKKVQKTISNNN